MTETQYKEFRYKDKDPQWQDDRWDYVYSVLGPVAESLTETDDRRWVINAHEEHPWHFWGSEIDHYIEILTWIKEQRDG